MISDGWLYLKFPLMKIGHPLRNVSYAAGSLLVFKFSSDAVRRATQDLPWVLRFAFNDP